ncbi:hypothetical protein LPJ59_006027, partial [Coemansia sp. RSA 2399]
WAHVFPTLDAFYSRYKTRYTSEYWPEGQPFHRRLRSCAYMQQQQADQRLVKSIVGGRDPKPVVVIGNWSAPMTRFHQPIRSIGMRRMMRRHKLKVVLIDEYCTSKTCPACDGILEKFHKVPNLRPFRARRRPEVLCNGLLRCVSKECITWATQNSGRKAREPEWVADGRYWNRDMVAVLNFRRIVHSLIATRSIPKPFRRTGRRTPATNDDTPATNDDTPATNDDTPATNDDTPAAGNGTDSDDDDDVAAQTQHRYPTRRRTGRNGGGTPATNDGTPATNDGTGSDDDDVAAQAQHRYPTRRRTGRNGGGTPATNDGTGSDDDDVAAQAQHRYPTRRRTGRDGGSTPGANDDTPAAGNGTGSDDDDVAAQAQHRYPTRRRTGRAPADNAQQQ